jgi:1-acyl-sn-glycerol-3-phosphate acyltransferase
MLPQGKEHEDALSLLENSKFTERIIVNVTAKPQSAAADPDSLIEFTDALVAQLDTTVGAYLKSIEYTSNDSLFAEVLNVINNNLPIFLEDNDYQKIDTLLSQEAIQNKVKSNFQVLTSPTGLALKEFVINDPLGLNYIVYNKLKAFQLDDNIELYDGHFITKDKSRLLLFLHLKYPSSETQQNAAFFAKLDKELQKTAGTNYDVTYFGETAVATGNATQIRKDSIFTSVCTIVLLVLLIVFFYKNISAPVLVMLPVLFGALFALTVIYFMKGGISVISVGAGAVILGIAVNYSLHFLTHYKYHPDMKEVIKDISFPMIIGSATTIGGFLCLQFLTIPVLKDLGLFAAFSLIGAALSTLIFLPHFVNAKSIENNSTVFDKIYVGLNRLHSNKYIAIAFIVMTPVLYHFAKQVKFENDLLKMNYMTPQLKHAEKVFNEFSSFYKKSVFVIAKGKTMDEALASNEAILPELNKMKANGEILSFSNVGSILVSDKEQQRRLDKWNRYWTPEKKNATLQALNREGAAFHFTQTAFAPFENQVSKEYTALSREDVSALKAALLNNFIEEKKDKISIINVVKTNPDYVHAIYAQFHGRQHIAVIDRQYITNQLVKIVGSDFQFITIFTTLIVFVALLLSYGRIELALITFIPMVIAWIWILGIMALLGIKFNIINIILSTFVFALGDDYCIFTTDGMQQQYATGKDNSRSLGTSIILSAVTTILGLGILIFAKHPALRSIALISIIGIICVWLMSQTLQPILFNILIKHPTDKKNFPNTFKGIVQSVIAFAYFVFGALLLTVIGVVLTKLIPFKRKQMKYAYHVVLSKFVKSLVYLMVNVKKTIINPNNEQFTTPAVIIANHQSFLDILVLVMLHPKIIMMTNKWVWNSPVFGFVVQMADYQLAENTEAKLDKIKEKVADGYSIIVYPEGTRNKHGIIQRFHKGAFYLAERLNIDILPIVLHGTGYCMSKNEFLLKDGEMMVKYLDRISPNDAQYGTGYAERTKLIAAHFKKEYAALSEQIEQPAYFYDQLVHNYIFKGPVLEWYAKVKIKLENNYAIFNDIIPKKNKILDIGCGYGFLDYMLSFTSKDRIIHGMDYDEEKIEVAQHGFLKSDQLNFSSGNVLDFTFEQYDTIILSDVLHYLQPDEQTRVLENCIQNITDDGMLMIRDGNAELTERHKGTKLTEWFSTKLLGFNKTSEQGLSFIAASFLKDFAVKNKLDLQEVDNTKYTSNIFFIMRKSKSI